MFFYNLNMYTKIGLILGDSILHGYFEQDDKLVTEMRNIYDLDIVKTSFQKGVTTSVLVHKAFPREMAELLKNNGCNILVDIFLISGAGTYQTLFLMNHISTLILLFQKEMKNLKFLWIIH